MVLPTAAGSFHTLFMPTDEHMNLVHKAESGDIGCACFFQVFYKLIKDGYHETSVFSCFAKTEILRIERISAAIQTEADTDILCLPQRIKIPLFFGYSQQKY